MDDELVIAVLRDEPGAWDELGPRLGEAIRPCFRRFFDEADTKDLIQITLMIIHRKLPEFEVGTGKSIRRWAQGIARLEAQEELRQGRRRARLVDGLAQVQRTPSTTLGTRLERAEQQAANHQLIREALDQLDTRHRRVIENDLEGGDIDEFAEREGIKRSTVRVRRHRAYKKMRQFIRERRRADPNRTPTPPTD